MPKIYKKIRKALSINFQKNKIKTISCDEGSAYVRLFKQILTTDIEKNLENSDEIDDLSEVRTKLDIINQRNCVDSNNVDQKILEFSEFSHEFSFDTQ